MPYKDIEKKRECDRRAMQRWIERNPEEHRRRSRESMRKYYANHPEIVKKQNENRKPEDWKKQNAKRKASDQAWWDAYKASLSCIRCGESHFACLEFHHIKPEEKKLKISHYTKGGWIGNKPKLLEELKKCIVLCANCHRKEHHKARLQ